MKSPNTLAAAVFATFAAAAFAGPYGAGGPNCPGGGTPGSAECAGPMGGNRGGMGPHGGPGRHGARMQEHLKAADTNADGMISKDEAKASMPRLHENFDAIDADRNGQISVEELRNARGMHRAGGARGEGWKQWDADGDGRLSRDEVAKAPRLSQQFDAIDADKDGHLTAEELQAAHRRFMGRGGQG